MDSQSLQRESLDVASLVAVACVIASWFWLNTLVTDAGRFQLGFHFYDMWALIGNPALLLTGIGDAHTTGGLIFGGVCVIAALAPLIVLLRDTTLARLAALAPLLLMWCVVHCCI